MASASERHAVLGSKKETNLSEFIRLLLSKCAHDCKLYFSRSFIWLTTENLLFNTQIICMPVSCIFQS